MNESDSFTRYEKDAAIGLMNQAWAAACFYAKPEDRQAAVVAVLRAALELAGGTCNLDRMAVLEREHAEFFDKWHDERRRREALEAL